MLHIGADGTSAAHKTKYYGARGDRTHDLLTASQALSQLSYGPISKVVRTTPRRRVLTYKITNLRILLFSARVNDEFSMESQSDPSTPIRNADLELTQAQGENISQELTFFGHSWQNHVKEAAFVLRIFTLQQAQNDDYRRWIPALVPSEDSGLRWKDMRISLLDFADFCLVLYKTAGLPVP